jgi:hypothetical protein
MWRVLAFLFVVSCNDVAQTTSDLAVSLDLAPQQDLAADLASSVCKPICDGMCCSPNFASPCGCSSDCCMGVCVGGFCGLGP